MTKISFIAYLQDSFIREKLLESLLAQLNIEDFSAFQLIIADSTGDGNNKEFFEQAANESAIDVLYLSLEGKNLAECYNAALEKASGDYVMFLDSDCSFSPKAISAVCNLIENEFPEEEWIDFQPVDDEYKNIIYIKPYFLRPDGRKTAYPIYPGREDICDVTENLKEMNLCLYSYIIRRDLIPCSPFNEQFPDECRQLFALEITDICPKAFCLNRKSVFFMHAMENAPSFFVPQHSETWYTYTLKECFIPILKEKINSGSLTSSFENGLLYLVCTRYFCNVKESDKGVLKNEKLNEFYGAVKEFLDLISLDAIIGNVPLRKYVIPMWLKWEFIKMKTGLDMSSVYMSGASVIINLDDYYKSGRPQLYQLYDFQEKPLSVYAINYENGNVIIDFSLPLLPTEWLSLTDAVALGAEVEPREVYNIYTCFGQVVARFKMFRATTELLLTSQEIKLKITNDGKNYKMPLSFKKPAARLISGVKESYWFFNGNSVMTYSAQKKELIIRRCTKEELKTIEANYALAITRDKSIRFRDRQNILDLRKQYYRYYFSKSSRAKPIWITFDKLYKAGDNGEYIYHYIRKHCRNIDMYYIVDEQSADYKRLRHDSHVLKYGSMKAKQLALRASVILATHVNTMIYCGMNTGNERKYLRDLYNGQVVCIQHGLTVQDIAIFQNELFDNTRLYCCASKYEIQNILQPEFGYNESQVKLDGLARYDGLINNDKKQILITPTWRRDIVNGGVACDKKTHNDYFKSTEYYRIYNSLINDKKLIECAKQYGYRLIYLLHPAMSSQIDDYDRNDYFELVQASGDMNYEKILTESSLMVTDYSGVQFDFAYMRKPVLYYHPASLPPHYDESSAFVYDTMGFGPIIDNHNELVEQICEYMKNNCVMDDEYKKRADDFFAFSDSNSCERIYKDIKAFSDSLNVEKGELLKNDLLDVSVREITLMFKNPFTRFFGGGFLYLYDLMLTVLREFRLLGTGAFKKALRILKIIK